MTTFDPIRLENLMPAGRECAVVREHPLTEKMRPGERVVVITLPQAFADELGVHKTVHAILKHYHVGVEFQPVGMAPRKISLRLPDGPEGVALRGRYYRDPTGVAALVMMHSIEQDLAPAILL